MTADFSQGGDRHQKRPPPFGDDLLIFTAATRQDGRKFLQRMSWGWDPAAAGGRAGLESCNSDDRCQRQKQEGAVGAAACKMRVPSKARSRCREPQPEYISRNFFDIADQPGLRAWLICFFHERGRKGKRHLSAQALCRSRCVERRS